VPTSTTQTLDLIDAAILRRPETGDPIGGGRRLFLQHVRDIVSQHGLPIPDELKLDNCVMPYVFQELNYDGYEWSERTADLGHLADMVDIDVIVWSGGHTRDELSDSEYNRYFDFCRSAIKHRSTR
jgi:hypothetical protein